MEMFGEDNKMANHFYGSAYEEHYEKKLKDFTFLDWVLVSIFWLCVLAAVVAGFCGHIGIMVAILGVVLSMFDLLIRKVFCKKSKITWIFVVLGILAIIAGIIVETEQFSVFQYYVVFMYMVIAFGVGFFCVHLKINNARKLKAYSLSVEAVCEMVDEKRINLFAFDDLVQSNYRAPINENTIYKPGFHYSVAGKEYFTESTVYYGDLNKGFKEGEKVQLKVNPDNPIEILPVNFDETIGNMALIMGIFWIVAGMVGIIVMILMQNGVISFI